MTEKRKLDEIRGAALDRIARSERNYRLGFYGAAAVEALFLLGFVLLADFRDRLHLLLLVATMATYTIIALGMLALGSHVSRNAQLVLRAIELLDSRLAGKMDRQP